MAPVGEKSAAREISSVCYKTTTELMGVAGEKNDAKLYRGRRRDAEEDLSVSSRGIKKNVPG